MMNFLSILKSKAFWTVVGATVVGLIVFYNVIPQVKAAFNRARA